MKKFLLFSVCLLIGQLIVFRFVENHNRTWGTLSVLIIGYFTISFLITLLLNGIRLLIKNEGRGLIYLTVGINIFLLIVISWETLNNSVNKNMIYILTCFFETMFFMLYASVYLIVKKQFLKEKIDNSYLDSKIE